MSDIEGEEFQDCLNEDCKTCGHPFNTHILVATMVTPQHGGLIFCPEPGCPCESTWSLDGEPDPYIPDADTIAHLRAIAQQPEE